MTPRAGLNSITEAEHDGATPATKKVSLYAVEGGTKKRLTTTAVSTNQALDVNVVQTVGGGADPVGIKDAAGTQATVTTVGADVGLDVNLINASVPVTGTFWQATQPISAASLPLPTGAATLAEQQTQTTALQLIDDPVATIGTTPLMRVALFDAADGQVTSFGGGTQYTEDDVVPANPIGTAMMMERDDVLGGLTPAAGDWTHPFATAEGALWTQDFNSDAILADTTAIKTAVQLLDNSVDGSYLNVNMNVAGTDVAAGNGTTNAQTLRVTVSSDSTGVLSVDDNGSSLTVDNADITSTKTAVELIDDAIKADDAAFTPGTTKVMMAGFEVDDSTPDAADEGDAVAARASKYRILYGMRPTGAFAQAEKLVTTAGTQVPLVASSTFGYNIKIKAKTTNVGNIYIGNSAVASTDGVILLPGETFELDYADLNAIYIDSDINTTEGVRFVYNTVT